MIQKNNTYRNSASPEPAGSRHIAALLQKVHRAEAALEAARQPLPSFYDFAAAVELEGRVGSVEHASAASVVTLQDEPDGFAMTTVKHHGSSLATTLTPVV